MFEAYIERGLAPTLGAGQEVVVMDNLSAHKGERVRELIEHRGCELLYLPPYSPDLNPIEEAFSKIKGILRKGFILQRRRCILREILQQLSLLKYRAMSMRPQTIGPASEDTAVHNTF